MRRPITLRQIEAFRAVMDAGSVSRAAENLNVSQPAVSKLISLLELDTALRLFDRVQRRLIPTEQGTRLYEELERIYAGVHQVEQAVDTIHREQRGHLIVGGSPAMEPFLRRVLIELLHEHPEAYVSVRIHTARVVVEWLRTRQIDVGIVTGSALDPSLKVDFLLSRPLVCMLPKEHPLTSKRVIKLQDLDDVPFVGTTLNGRTAMVVNSLFNAGKFRHRLVMDLTSVSAVSEFVAAGFGVSLLHPLLAAPYFEKIAIRPFEPRTELDFQVCRSTDLRKSSLAIQFLAKLEVVANEIEAGFEML